MSEGLVLALDRLIAFRANWNEGDQIDEESHLTAADLDEIIAHCRATDDMVAVQRIDLGRMPPPQS